MDIKLRVIVIDDELLAREIVKKFISANNSLELIGECENGFEGLKLINEEAPDLIFLDVQMPKINGFEMLELIENPPSIIFTTAFDEFALKAFEVNAVDYLLKPFTKERFDSAVEKSLNQIKDNPVLERGKINKVLSLVENREEVIDRVVVKNNNKIFVIPVEKIKFFEAQDDYVLINSELGRFLKQKTMLFFETHLKNTEFIRVHRSYLVKFTYIKQLESIGKDTYQLTLTSGEKIPVSRKGYSRLKELLQ